MESLDKIDLVGDFSVYKAYKDKPPILAFREENLIINVAKRKILASLYGPVTLAYNDPITTLKVGRSGTIDPAGLYPKAEDPNQSALIDTSPVSLAVTYTADPTNILITFFADLPNEDTAGNRFNNNLISEAGLFRNSGEMFNIKNHPGIYKTVDFSLHYVWIVKIL